MSRFKNMRPHIIRTLIACAVLLGIAGCMGHRAGVVHYEYRQADGKRIKATVYRSVGIVEPRTFPDLGIQVSLPKYVKNLYVEKPRNGNPGVMLFEMTTARFDAWYLENRSMISGEVFLFPEHLYKERAGEPNVTPYGALTNSPAGEHFVVESEKSGSGADIHLTKHRINVVSQDGDLVVAGIVRGSYENMISDAVRREEIRKEDEAMIRAILESIRFVD